MTKEQRFIEDIASYIKKYAKNYNIKIVSPIIAQACLESAYGTSELATYAHNYFGLKYRPNRCPSACGIYYKIGSEQNADGTYVSSAMQWMKFSNMEQGVIGYFDFINNATYANLKNVTNPKTYLENIKKDGYATSLNYVNNLMNVIHTWDLTKYDFQETEENKMIIAIDAGHASNTAGKRTPDGYREHWINVKTAYYCEQALRRHNLDTIRIAWDDLDATNDKEVSLAQRQKLIKNAGAIISISCHANAHGNGAQWTSAKGVETLIHSDPTKAKDSRKLAELVQKYMAQGTAQTNRGVKLQNLAMCNCINMGTKASILIETGFMTNEYEANLLKTDAFCKEQGEQAAHGICEYLGIHFIANDTTTSETQSTSTPKQLYRVRKSWNDAKSQIGAYSNLETAKKVCKSGYSVFDSNGNKVYPITSSTVVTQPVTATNDEIKKIQTWLNKTYNFNLKVDGIFGMNSMNALIKAVQREMGVKESGKFDTFTTLAATKSKNIIKQESKNNLVRLWQGYLIAKGYNPRGFDGIFGIGCAAATKEFQVKNKLKNDGIVGVKTWAKALG